MYSGRKPYFIRLRRWKKHSESEGGEYRGFCLWSSVSAKGHNGRFSGLNENKKATNVEEEIGIETHSVSFPS